MTREERTRDARFWIALAVYLVGFYLLWSLCKFAARSFPEAVNIVGSLAIFAYGLGGLPASTSIVDSVYFRFRRPD